MLSTVNAMARPVYGLIASYLMTNSGRELVQLMMTLKSAICLMRTSLIGTPKSMRLGFTYKHQSFTPEDVQSSIIFWKKKGWISRKQKNAANIRTAAKVGKYTMLFIGAFMGVSLPADN